MCTVVNRHLLAEFLHQLLNIVNIIDLLCLIFFSLWLNLIRKVREVSNLTCLLNAGCPVQLKSRIIGPFPRLSCHPWPFRGSAASLPASQTETPCRTRPVTRTPAHPGSAKAPPFCRESQSGEVLSRREATAKVCHDQYDFKGRQCHNIV